MIDKESQESVKGTVGEYLKGKWIPIKTRPLTDEEKEIYSNSEYCCDIAFMYDCPLPESGDEVLITTRCGCVVCTTFFNDDNYGAYFECYEGYGDVKAWMPLPKPYSIYRK